MGRFRGVAPGRGAAALMAVALSGSTAACGLTEVALAPEVDALVVEATFQWRQLAPNQLVVWIHRTLGSQVTTPVDATVFLGLPDENNVVLTQARPREDCVELSPEAVNGSCYRLTGGALQNVSPGDLLTFRVTTTAGEELEGASRVPELHTLLSSPDGSECYLTPFTPIRLGWTRSPGAWAYVNETLIYGLRDAYRSQGIEVDEDPLSLLGISISAQDTTVVFPGEFGLFQRGDLDQDLAVALQAGLPPETLADVVITAADRNLVNWARGGNFNPSGQVRVPSLRGDGTGFFGTSVLKGFRIIVPDALPAGAALCQPVGPLVES